MRVVLTGGGTGGHLAPFEPIIDTMRSVFPEEQTSLPGYLDPEALDIRFVGIVDDKTKEMMKRYDIPTIHIPSGKIRRYASVKTVSDLFFHLPIGIVKALYHMWHIMPDVVISKGGYGSIPTILAAFFYRVPVLLHESDVVPGVTNRKLLRFSSAITVGFAGAKQYFERWSYKVFVTGTPVRLGEDNTAKAESRRVFDIPESEHVLLVTGGSQGAQQLNETLLKILPELITKVTVLHLTGEEHFRAVSTVGKEILKSSPRKDYYKPYPYLAENMIHALVACDTAVTRAGASTLAEISRLRIPSLVIPLSSAAQDHQRKNAQALESKGAIVVLDPTNVTRNIFLQAVQKLIEDAQLRSNLQYNLAAVDHPNAAKDIVKLSFQLARGYLPKKQKNA